MKGHLTSDDIQVKSSLHAPSERACTAQSLFLMQLWVNTSALHSPDSEVDLHGRDFAIGH